MAGKSLVGRVADVVDGWLSVEGFVRHGLAWHLENDLGDLAVVDLHKRPRLPGMELFSVAGSLVPRPWWSWMLTIAPRAPRNQQYPNVGDGVLDIYVDAPQVAGVGLAGGPSGLGWTVSSPEEAVTVGNQVGALLTSGPVAKLRRLLDRTQLLAELRSRPHSPAIEAALLTDAGSSPELDAALDRCVEEWPQSGPFLSWAREYAKTRAVN